MNIAWMIIFLTQDDFALTNAIPHYPQDVS